MWQRGGIGIGVAAAGAQGGMCFTRARSFPQPMYSLAQAYIVVVRVLGLQLLEDVVELRRLVRKMLNHLFVSPDLWAAGPFGEGALLRSATRSERGGASVAALGQAWRRSGKRGGGDASVAEVTQAWQRYCNAANVKGAPWSAHKGGERRCFGAVGGCRASAAQPGGARRSRLVKVRKSEQESRGAKQGARAAAGGRLSTQRSAWSQNYWSPMRRRRPRIYFCRHASPRKGSSSSHCSWYGCTRAADKRLR